MRRRQKTLTDTIVRTLCLSINKTLQENFWKSEWLYFVSNLIKLTLKYPAARKETHLFLP